MSNAKRISLDRSKLLGFDQLPRRRTDSCRTDLQDVRLLTKVGEKAILPNQASKGTASA